MEIDKLQLCILAVLEENNATTPGTGMTLREIGSVINTEEEHTYSQITINRKVWGLRDLGYVTSKLKSNKADMFYITATGKEMKGIQNTGMSIRELNNQFRNLGVTFTTVENGSTKLDEIWSELFNIKPSFQGIDSFGGQINAVVNELKIAKEAMYGDSNLMPAQRTGATTTYLNAWLEMLEKLSQRVEILKTEQANLQNQMAQASNNATNAVVANQQKQQQAYQQTGSVIQAVTSNTSVIGNMPKEASDIGDAKNQLSQLLQNEKAVIATTQHFDNDGMMRTFTLNVKRATGEVESLNYAFRQVTDNNGNVTDTYFENTSSHLNDSGAIKQIDAIEEAFSDYTTEIAKFKSTNAEILSGLDTPLKDFETKLAGLKTGASTVNEVKSAFNSLNTEAAKITQNFSKQLSPIDRAVSKIANGEETIKGLRAELKGLDNAPKDLSKELNQCVTTLQKVKDIEAKEGRTENWSKAYKQWAESIDTVTSKIKTLKKEQSNVASTQVFNTSDLKANNIAYMSKVHNTIEKQMVEINRLANANGWSDVKVTGVEEASGKIQKLTLTVRDAEGALKQFNMQREKIQGNGKAQAGLVQTGDVKVLETAVQYAEKLKSIENSMGQFGNTTTSITNLEKSFTKLGISTDEVNSKMEAVKTEYATLQNMMSNGANAGTPANASKAKNKLEKDNPKKKGKYGYAKRYHKGLELGKIEALPKDKAFDLVQDVGINGLKADEVPIIAQKREAVLTEEQIENLAKTLHLVPVQNEIMEKMSKISLGDLPMNTPKMNFDAGKVGQNVTKNNFAPSINITFNCPNLTNESGVQYVEKAMDKYMNKFANDFYQVSLHYVNRKQ